MGPFLSMLIKTKQARLSTEELFQLKWVTGCFLALLSMWSLASLEMKNGFLLVPGISLVAFTILRPRWLGIVAPFTWKAIGPVLLLLIAVDFAFARSDFLPSLVRMIIALLVYRALAPRKRREDLQLVLLCLFSLVISGVLTVSLLFALQILLFTPLAMTQLFLICILDRGVREAASLSEDWSGVNIRRLWKRVCRTADVRVFALGSILFACVVALSSLIFVAIPRFDIDQALPFLQLQTEPRSGFDETVEFGSVSKIKLDDSVAFRVDLPGQDAIDSAPYWRMLVLDEYGESGFSLSENAQNKDLFQRNSAVKELQEWQVWSYSSRNDYSWTVYMEGGISRYLPLPGSFEAMRFTTPQDVSFSEPLKLVRLGKVQQSVSSFQMVAPKWTRRIPASQVEVAVFPTLDVSELIDQEFATYPSTTLQLNISEDDRDTLKEINSALISDLNEMPSAAAYSQALTEYLRGKYRYSLEPDEGGGADDHIVKWLKGGRKGHCELFAGSFTLIARDAGYPARLVVGFAGGAWNSVEEYFLVRNREAHAWVEIFDSASNEWLRVDPTPGDTPSDPDLAPIGNLEQVGGMTAWIDSLRIQWYRRIVNFDQDDQIGMAVGFTAWWNAFSETVSERLGVIIDEIKAVLAAPFSGLNLVKLLLPFGVCVLLIIGWRFRIELLGLFSIFHKEGRDLNPLRAQAGRYLRRLNEASEWKSLKSPDVDLLAGKDIKRDLEAIRFGPSPDGLTANEIFRRAKRYLKSRN